MKNKWLFVWLLGCLNTAVHAESRWAAGAPDERPHLFAESSEALPPVPQANASGWFELYIAPTYSGKALILSESVRTAADGSIRYILNRRSAAGYDNISAEGLYCFTGNRWLGSDGAQVKTFAYADTANQRWMMPRRADWQVIGGKMNSVDRVRGVLYEAFCIDGKAKNDEDLRARLHRLAGLFMPERHDK